MLYDAQKDIDDIFARISNSLLKREAVEYPHLPTYWTSENKIALAHVYFSVALQLCKQADFAFKSYSATLVLIIANTYADLTEVQKGALTAARNITQTMPSEERLWVTHSFATKAPNKSPLHQAANRAFALRLHRLSKAVIDEIETSQGENLHSAGEYLDFVIENTALTATPTWAMKTLDGSVRHFATRLEATNPEIAFAVVWAISSNLPRVSPIAKFAAQKFFELFDKKLASYVDQSIAEDHARMLQSKNPGTNLEVTEGLQAREEFLRNTEDQTWPPRGDLSLLLLRFQNLQAPIV